MIIKSLKIQNFRNISKKEFAFSDGVTVIFGKNTSGKTNILEAIYLLSTGKSFRATREDEMIAQNEELARVEGTVQTKERRDGVSHAPKGRAEEQETVELQVMVVRPTEESRGGKRLTVNGVSRHLYTFVGNLKAVMFGPWDLSLVTESPSIRRRFLDSVLSLTDREYRRSILSYEKGVRQRNRVLERIREGLAGRSQLLYWDHLLIREGNLITSAREKFVEFVNTTSLPGEELSLEYDRSVISEGRLKQYEEEEVLASTTLVGPHRDDLIFKSGKGTKSTKGIKSTWELSKYGSRGEQRMAVLWVKLAELDFIERETGERPVLLLDDIFSELDEEHHNLVLETVRCQQTILTTAEERNIQKWENVSVVRLG